MQCSDQRSPRGSVATWVKYVYQNRSVDIVEKMGFIHLRRAEGDLEISLALVADGVGGRAIGNLVRVGPAHVERQEAKHAVLDLTILGAVAVGERLNLHTDLLVRALHHGDVVSSTFDTAPARVAELSEGLRGPLSSGTLVGLSENIS